MASVLDLGLIDYFLPIFVFFLIFVVVFALLEKTNFFPGNKFANLMIAFCLAVLFIVIPELQTVIALATPWFIVLFVFLFLLILVFLFMGVSSEHISGVFGGAGGAETNLTVVWAIIIISLAIFGYAFTQVYGEQIHSITSPDDVDDTDLVTNIGQIIFTPEVLGLAFLLALAGFAVRFISAANE